MIPPAELPTWRDVPCEGPPCDSDLFPKIRGTLFWGVLKLRILL